MKKRHVTPEFQVICQNVPNAKFFVASFENQGTGGQTSDTASEYTDGGNVSVW